MTLTSFDYLITETDPATRVVLSGPLTFGGHRPLRRLLDDLAARAQPRRVVFDLSQATEIDPAGLGLLLIARDFLGGNLSLAAPKGPVERVLTLTGFDRQIPRSD